MKILIITDNVFITKQAIEIIEKHNGIITAKSKPNEGSSFIVILPL